MNITALGELLIDFTMCGKSKNGANIFEQNPGGAPANVLSCLAKLGQHTAFIGKVGKDMHGEFLRQKLLEENIDVSNLILDDNFFTTLAFVSISESGERSFSFARKPGADTNLRPEEIDLNLLKKSDIFHFGSLSLTDYPAHDATMFALKKAKEYGSIISYDPNYRNKLWKSEQYAKQTMRLPLKYVNIIKISDEECELITDSKDPYEACKILSQKGINIVLVTLGKQGCLACVNSEISSVQGFKAKEVVDTTGAGDSFLGGFLYKFAESRKKLSEITLDDACEFALFGNGVASLCIEKTGAINSMPSLCDVLDRMKHL